MRTWLPSAGWVVSISGLALLSGGLSGCASVPVQSVTSLSPAIQAGTVGYNNAVGTAADQILLTNILRARDLQPINLSQLSSISGSLSLQGTLGFTLPWGKVTSPGQNSAGPSVTAATTPTFSLSPLNTQGFTLNILQPVSANYVQSMWQAGVSREYLMLLFVKEIDFPDSKIASSDPSIATRRYVNDPDDESRFRAFTKLVDDLVSARAQLKAVDVLDPVGPPISLYAAVTTTTTTTYSKPPDGKPSSINTSTSNQTDNADSTGFGLFGGSNDGQYHLGNVTSPSEGSDPGGQLYRVYAGQVELCVDRKLMKAENIEIPEVNSPLLNLAGSAHDVATKASDTLAVQVNGVAIKNAYSFAGGGTLSAGGQTGAAHGASGGGAGGGAGAQGAASTGGSNQTMTAALQAGRVSALVGSDGCLPDEIVLNISSEELFQDTSKSFVHVQWRSVSEIFEYLGAILRYNERHRNLPFRFVTAADPTISVLTATASGAKPSTNVAISAPTTAATGSAAVPGCDASTEGAELRCSSELFTVSAWGSGDLSASYNGRSYAVANARPNSPNGNYTLRTIDMLSVLVNYASQATSGSSSQPLRLLPLP